MADAHKIPFKVAPRLETGAVEFIDDWPGVFIRGDDSFAYAMYLDAILEYIEVNDVEDYIAVANVEALRDLLRSCEVKLEQ